MQTFKMSFSQFNFGGRSGLSRSLKARFTETHFIYAFAVMAAVLGFMTIMTNNLLVVFFFAMSSYIAWVLFRTASVSVNLHGETLFYESANKESAAIAFADIDSLKIKHNRGVYGFFIMMKSGESHHFPIHLERLDYILDTLHFHRSDLTQSHEFYQFRCRALALDHVLAHHKSYLSRMPAMALLFYLMYPVLLAKAYKRLQADPTIVSRDLEYEAKMEQHCRKLHIGAGLLALALVLWKFHL